MDKFSHQSEHTRPPFQLSQDNLDTLPTDLRRVAQLYTSQPVPHPTPEATQLLMGRLLQEETVVARAELSWRPLRLQILRIARWQIVLLGPWFWVIGILFLAGSFLLAPFFSGIAIVNLLIILLPFTAILSVVYAVHRLALRVHEVEASCPNNIVETTTALVLAIVFFDILLGLVATGAVSLANWVDFSALLATWLGPLLLLVGISLPVALRWGTGPAMLIGGVPWLYVAGMAIMEQYDWRYVSLVNQNTTSLLFSWLSALLGLVLLLTLFLRGSSLQRHLLHHR